MSSVGELVVSNPEFVDNTLRQVFSGSKDVMRYVKEPELFIKYDCEVEADESILNVPLTSALLPLAWLTGSDVFVEGSLDKRFMESMGELKREFGKMFPKVSYEAEIYADEVVDNKNPPMEPRESTGLLFSGGIDSAYTFYHNQHLNMKLVTIWGIDDFPYPGHGDHWEKTIELHGEFAHRKNLDYFVIKTNVCRILDNKRIQHKFFRELYNGTLEARYPTHSYFSHWRRPCLWGGLITY